MLCCTRSPRANTVDHLLQTPKLSITLFILASGFLIRRIAKTVHYLLDFIFFFLENNINNILDHIIFTGVNENQGFYFVHSYYYECENEQNILTVCNYGLDFSSSIFNENIFGMQFHPEKSHSNGETLLKNFAKLDIC